MTPLASRPLPVSVSIALTVVAAVLVLLGGFLAGAVRAAGFAPGVTVLLVGACITGAYALVVGSVWGVARAHGLSLDQSVAWRAPASWPAALSLAVAVALAGRLVGGAWALALSRLGIELPGADIDPTALFGSGPLGIAVAVATMVIAAPLAEELVFRGALLSSLEGAIDFRAAVALSSLAFALAHVTAYTIPPIFVFGLLLGAVTGKTRSVPVAVAAHATFNGIAIAALYALKAGWGV